MSIEQEDIDIIKDDNDKKKDSIVFSVTYKNYLENIATDREDKILGQWNIIKDREKHLKFAYAYLKDSEKMIIKKYEIESIFPTTDDTRWDITKNRKAFKFKSSADTQFEYPGPQVQGRHYRYSSELDSVFKLSDAEADRRFKLSREGRENITRSVTSKTRKKEFNHISFPRTMLSLWKNSSLCR